MSFKLNQGWIAENLCINRDKPETHCNGKCHLKAQIQKQEQEDTHSPRPLPEEMSWVLFSYADEDRHEWESIPTHLYPPAQDQHLPESRCPCPPFQPPETVLIDKT